MTFKKLQTSRCLSSEISFWSKVLNFSIHSIFYTTKVFSYILWPHVATETVFFRTEQRKISFNSSFSTDSDWDENIAFNFYPQGARQSPRKGTCIHVVNKHNLCIRLRLSLAAMVTTANSIHLNKHGKFLIQGTFALVCHKSNLWSLKYLQTPRWQTIHLYLVFWRFF